LDQIYRLFCRLKSEGGEILARAIKIKREI
jgi:hypothetical protein